ncbi:MAG: hypothetical protein ACK4SZ_02260 [Allosphingosinicella sp.]|uniref:hypothetical protein n=1 Tax=Allosphingosinicella sp. TaxID=2823234 RepID=UPI0039617547
MNKFIATMAAVSALAIAAPAVAQPGYGGQQQNNYRGGNADANLSARIDQLQMRLQAGVQSGSITRQEAMPLRQQLRQLTQLQRQYARNGISGQERGELQRRMRDLRQGIRRADGNEQARWDRYDREDGYGRDGQWSGGYADEGQYQQPRSGLGGVIDSVFGGGGLSVGQRASSGLYGLQGGYRDQYRDGNGAYYRTDGRQIYQIDARTQTVVRVYPMNR